MLNDGASSRANLFVFWRLLPRKFPNKSVANDKSTYNGANRANALLVLSVSVQADRSRGEVANVYSKKALTKDSSLWQWERIASRYSSNADPQNTTLQGTAAAPLPPDGYLLAIHRQGLAGTGFRVFASGSATPFLG